MNPIQQIKSYDFSQTSIIFVTEADKSKIAENYNLNIPFFKAKKNETQLIEKNSKMCFLVGLEDEKELGKLKNIAKKFSHQNKENIEAENISIVFPESLNDQQIKHLMIGLFEGTYKINIGKDDKTFALWNENVNLSLYQPNTKFNLDDLGLEARYLVEGKFMGMDLLNLPPNQKNSEILAHFVTEFAENLGLELTILNKKECKKAGLSSFLSVNQGSAYEPAFMILEYRPKNAKKTIGIVGKCITFDTGGISIKPSENMHYMKSDMGGATTVLGTLLSAVKLQLEQNIVAILPATDNAVDKNSYLPGDVIDSYAGKTIEVINTDAEGRMTLADGLAYLNDKYNPDVLLDIATLTGSAVRTLGHKAAAMLTVSDEISETLSKLGNEIGEKVWRLPLWDEYLEDLKSDVADLKHISLAPLSDVIYAGKFLEQFTNEHPNWVHLDIAGVAFGNNDYSKDKSATGYGVELLINFIKSI